MGQMQGGNSSGSTGYFGMKPLEGDPHHYHFQLFALDTTLDLPAGADRQAVLNALSDHVLAKGDLVRLFQKL